MFDDSLISHASIILDRCRSAKLTLASAESCTGGLIAGLFTEIAGSSDVFERGFVTYSNDAKQELLGVKAATLQTKGAVSEEVAREMVAGALHHSHAKLAVAVTGIAGPGGGSAEKPVGLVHIAAARSERATLHKKCLFGDIGRAHVRRQTIIEALNMVEQLLEA